MDPASPSRLVPGAWPASPCPSRYRCSSTGGPRLRQHKLNLSYHEISPRRAIHSYFDSKAILATPTADITPTSFTFDDLSLQSSLTDTSFSSAYMNPSLENSPLKPEQDESRQCQDELDRHTSERGMDMYFKLSNLPGDQTHLSLPEIPDISSSVSSLQDFQTTQDNFNVSDNETSFLTFDKNTFEMQPSSFGHGSLDTLSSSSIRFRRTEVPPLEWGAHALQLPQPEGRDCWSLFLSPVSEGRSLLPLQLAPTPLGVRMSGSECQNKNQPCTDIRRSWMTGNHLPVPANVSPEEETSTRRYASEVLDRAFRMDADGSIFTLGIPGVDVNVSSKIPPPKVVTNPRRRVKISHIAKRLVHRVLNMSRNEGTMLENPTDQGPAIQHSRHCSLDEEDSNIQVRDLVLPHGGPGPQRQSLQACTLYDIESSKGGPELRAREFKVGDIKIGKHSAVSTTPGAPFRYQINPSLHHLSAFQSERPRPHRITSENLSHDIFKLGKPKRNHRRSFLRRVGI